ncbi:FHA domain-containing protein [Mucilaginibacter ginsenosidivorax]|uniref:FHA domain-containing protein n=1 Tax=Mucilaginibacter ginsenosidivorax TaxID=862126 RepID=A0A5B8VYA0_9SPHI|nr:FHA domain-containing protein [Mucilaginibacter ginsenosidivorax]QEC75615.1 FHA domain-containing protein [Mucilaginibacter ginsenosidivorax]
MAFSFFSKSGGEKGQVDVKGLREAILRFIKEALQKVEGGEGRHIKELLLYLAPDPDDKHLYEGAVYVHEKEVFRNEIQRIADDYAIELPDDWTIDVIFADKLPADVPKIPEIDVAFQMHTRRQVAHNASSAIAYIRILSGEAEQEEYLIKATDGKINIGRDKKVITENGSYRLNKIIFPADSNDPSNKFISRQHAHIEWNKDAECFMIFADEGGVPPRNKTKISIAADDKLIKLNSTQIGHPMNEGDQVILGESVVFLFSVKAEG